jgi:hypothetical protein
MVIETLNFYYQATNSRRPFEIIPVDSWNNTRQTDIRSYMWENVGPSDKRGAGTAFASFGAGQLVDFKDAKPGDFVSLDREKFRPQGTWQAGDEYRKFSQKFREHPVFFEGKWGVWQTSGHSTVFLGYLDESLKWTKDYPGDQTVGFLYFSSQGRPRPNGGFNYRWAIFKGAKDSKGRIVCETMPALSAPLDCGLGGIERKVRVGRLWHPKDWDADRPRQLREELEKSLTASLSPVVMEDLNALTRAVPDGQLSIPHLPKLLSGQQITAPIAKAVVDQAVKALVDRELVDRPPLSGPGGMLV